MSGFNPANPYFSSGGGGNYGGFSDTEAMTDEQGNTTFVPIYRTGAQNDIVRHDLSMILRKLLLRIAPKHDMKTEIADHGLKTEPGTPDELLASENTQALTVRPSNLPFAKDNPRPRNLNPRRSLRVSR